ncbi:hypothetical protein PIB30_102185, partial [Stylosanthes scabra]|nr:hypothetical protein [Stylosanthes scabra]
MGGGGLGSVSPSGLRGGLGSLSPSRWGARLGSGTPLGRGLATRLRVPGTGSKFDVLLSQFLNFQLHRLHAMSQFLGNLGLIRTNSTERSLGRATQSNPIKGTLSIAMDWVPRGRLPILDSSRIRINVAHFVAAAGPDVDRRRSGQCKPRLLRLGRPLSVTL